MGESVEQVLQASMFTHSTLTQGEWVQVQHAGTQHDLKVLALKPAAAVSIIGMASCQVVMGGLLFWLVAIDTKRSPARMLWCTLAGAEVRVGGGWDGRGRDQKGALKPAANG